MSEYNEEEDVCTALAPIKEPQISNGHYGAGQPNEYYKRELTKWENDEAYIKIELSPSKNRELEQMIRADLDGEQPENVEPVAYEEYIEE